MGLACDAIVVVMVAEPTLDIYKSLVGREKHGQGRHLLA